MQPCTLPHRCVCLAVPATCRGSSRCGRPKPESTFGRDHGVTCVCKGRHRLQRATGQFCSSRAENRDQATPVATACVGCGCGNATLMTWSALVSRTECG